MRARRSGGDLLREPSAAGGDPPRGVRALPADGARLRGRGAGPPPQLLHPQLRRGPRPGRPRRRSLPHVPARGRHRRPSPRHPATADDTAGALNAPLLVYHCSRIYIWSSRQTRIANCIRPAHQNICRRQQGHARRLYE